MKQDLERLMEERNLDGAVVLGDSLDSPTVYYLTGGAQVQGVIIMLRPGRPTVLVHSPIERENAAQTGFLCVPYSRWDLRKIHEAVDGDPLLSRVELMRQVLAEFGVQGRVGFYGHGDIGQQHTLLQAMGPTLHAVEIVTEYTDDLFTMARATKDEHEIRAMRHVGEQTSEVVAAVADLLTSSRVSNNVLITPGGEPLTVGQVKAFVRRELSVRNLEAPGDFIFAVGADAGVPHHHGNPDDVLELGKTIVFDLYPRLIGGGYYHDMTRTWCLGYASPEVERAYEDVMASFDLVTAALKVNRPTSEYQVLTCEYFDKRGHPTIMTEPRSTSGYVHGLGHGLGLEVHEAPSFSHLAASMFALEPGSTFTVEPGLYYPERGYGLRVEDTFYCDSAGNFHSLTPFRKDLVLPVGT